MIKLLINEGALISYKLLELVLRHTIVEICGMGLISGLPDIVSRKKKTTQKVLSLPTTWRWTRK